MDFCINISPSWHNGRDASLQNSAALEEFLCPLVIRAGIVVTPSLRWVGHSEVLGLQELTLAQPNVSDNPQNVWLFLRMPGQWSGEWLQVLWGRLGGSKIHSKCL